MEHQIINNMDCLNLYHFSPNLVTVRAYGDNWRSGNFSQAESSSELTHEDAYPSIHDQSATEMPDTFGLEFAAVQWLNLVTNAEQLFNRLLTSIVLNKDEKEQIERWLCLKQECEECVASDEATSLGEQHRHSLERIDELTEKTNVSTNSLRKSSDSQYESETESDFESHPDFEDKLDGYVERFKDKTDELIRQKLVIEEAVGPTPKSNDNVLPFGVGNNAVYLQGRRKSLHPGSLQFPSSLGDAASSGFDSSDSPQGDSFGVKCTKEHIFGAEPHKELKILSSGNDVKKTQIKQMLVDLESTHKRIENLQHTIQLKEQFINDMNKNSGMRHLAKLKLQSKWSKLEAEYYIIRTQLAQAESVLIESKKMGDHESLLSYRNEVEKLKVLARQREKMLKDTELMKQIAGDSAKKVLELENSLHTSNKQLEKFMKHLERGEAHMLQLEQEFQEDQQKIKQLEEKYNVQLPEKERKHGKSESERLKWIAEETERLNVMRESSQKLHQQLVQQQNALDKREALFQEKFNTGEHSTNIQEVTARISQLENILKDRNNVDVLDEKEEKEAVRQEIYNLRKTRDHLLEQRSNLDEKYSKDRRLSTSEERHYLECAEAIEAIDAAIEYKNELICGRKGLESPNEEKDQGEQLLMARLFKLSPDELRTMLYKYFQKVIDLRESGKRMEEQLNEIEHQGELQAWKVQELNHALQSERLESERRLVALQREHQEKVHLMLRHFAEESGGSGTEAGRQLIVSRDGEIAKLKRENKALRKRVQETEAVVQTAVASHGILRLRSRSCSPDCRQVKTLPPATKVTREKNKMIIRRSSSKKKSTNKDVNSFNQKK